MGVLITANSDAAYNDRITAALRHAFHDERVVACVYANSVLELFDNERVFRPSIDLQTRCIVIDSELVPTPDAEDKHGGITAEYLAEELRDRGYSGLIVHYGMRDLAQRTQTAFNASLLRTCFPVQSLVDRIKRVQASPEHRFTLSSGITLSVLQ